MRRNSPSRRLAVLMSFLVGVVATAATSSAYPTIDVTGADGNITLDASHPAAVARIVFKANAEATSGRPDYNVSITLHMTATRGATAWGHVDPSLVRVIATSSPPGIAPLPEGAGSASPGAEPGTSAPTSEGWQVDLTSDIVAKLPIDCGAGPCERTYWVLAAATGDTSRGIIVSWGVDGQIGWSAGAAPAGAAATVSIDPPVALSEPASALTASTDGETIPFGPDRLAAARVVEVTADASVIRSDGGPSAALTVDVQQVSQGGLPTDYSTSLQRVVYPLDGPLAATVALGAAAGAPGNASRPPTTPPGASPAEVPVLASGTDPFAGCPAGKPCTRRFLVSFALDNGVYAGSSAAAGTHPYEWRLTVRRTDLVRAWASPGAMTARVVRRFDIAPGAPVLAHAEGDVPYLAHAPSPPAHIVIDTSTTSSDPLAQLLLVPAAMTVRVAMPAAWPDASAAYVDVQVAKSYYSHMFGQPEGSDIVVRGFPAAGPACRVGTACPDLSISVSARDQPPSQVTYHWSLDIAVYSYNQVPVTATATIVAP